MVVVNPVSVASVRARSSPYVWLAVAFGGIVLLGFARTYS